MTSNLGWNIILISFTTSLLCVDGANFTVYAPGGVTCPTCDITLSDVVSNPQRYLTSDTILTFLPGTHILDQADPVVVSDVSNLVLHGAAEMEDGFHWTVKQANVYISCLNSTGGFVFNRSTVYIRVMTFVDCGISLSKRYLQSRYVPFHNGLYSSAYNFEDYSSLWSTLYFIDSKEVALYQLSVQNCSGSCLYFLNTQTVNMNEVYIAHNTPDHALQCCNSSSTADRYSCVGGNVIFFYLDSLACTDDSDGGNVTISNSSFSFGAGSFISSTIMAGMTFVHLTNANLKVVIDSTTFYANNGGNFGTLSTTSKFLFENVSSLHANRYLCSFSPLTIAFKVSVTNELLCETDNKKLTQVNVNNSHFSDNTAIDASGLNIDTSYVIVFTDQEAEVIFYVSNTYIINNRGTSASCIGSGSPVGYPAVARFFLSNVTMTGNSVYDELIEFPYKGIPPTCVVMINTEFARFDNVIISDHALAGIYSFASNIGFSGSVLIANNTGQRNGGGLILQESSNIYLLPNTTVSFIGNKAEFGAAMYIYEPRFIALIYQDVQLCVYQIQGSPNTSSSQFYFSDNVASITGNIVYGGYVANCLLYSDPTVTLSTQFFPNIFNFHQSSKMPLLDISSVANELCFCENGSSLCGLSHYNISGFLPGQTATVSVIPIGQSGGFTVGTVSVVSELLHYMHSVTSDNAVCIDVPLPLKISGDGELPVEYFSSEKMMAINFTLHLERFSAIDQFNPKIITVAIDPCPPGFMLNTTFVCECVTVLQVQVPNAICEISNNSISHSGNVWIGYDENGNYTIVSSVCPFDYCIHSTVTFNIIDSPDLQCANHRSGVLCGECAEGYSLLLGSNDCGLCPNNNYLSLLLVFGVAGIALVVLLIALNLTVSVGTINGLIFYANIVKINESIFFPNGSVVILSNFISFINLDFGIKTCFYRGMTPYAKVWLQFVFPVYILVIILLISVLCRYSSKLSRLVGSNAVPVLATLVLLSYTKLIRAYALVFRASTLYREGRSKIYAWGVDGELTLSSINLRIIFAFGLFVLLFLIIPFTLFVTFVPLLEKHLSAKCGRLWLRFLKPVLDAYSGPFNDSKRYWVGFGLIARLLIAIVVPVIPDRDALLVVFFVVLFLLSLFALFGGYYKNKYLNFLEVWTNLNLLAIIVFGLGDLAYIGTPLTVALMLITFIGIVGFHIMWRVTETFSDNRQKIASSFLSSLSKNSEKTEQDKDSKRQQRMSSVTVRDFNEDEEYNDRFRESLMEYMLDDS